MRKHFFPLVGLSAGMLLTPFVSGAQQHGAAAPGIPMQGMVPARPIGSPAPAAAMHAPAHAPAGSSPAQAAHPVTRSSAPGTHPTSTRLAGHPTPVHAHPVHSGAGVTNRPSAPGSALSGDDYLTPGLGFDYTHYAAVHPDDHHRHSNAGAIFPFVGGGIYLPTTGYLDEGAMQPQPEDAQPAEAVPPGGDSVDVAPIEQSPTRVRSRTYQAPATSPEYIFVRKDGTVFFAVAYSWTNGNLQYVTQDGLRKLVGLNTLDLDATAQFNEQRGLAFRAPV